MYNFNCDEKKYTESYWSGVLISLEKRPNQENKEQLNGRTCRSVQQNEKANFLKGKILNHFKATAQSDANDGLQFPFLKQHRKAFTSPPPFTRASRIVAVRNVEEHRGANQSKQRNRRKRRRKKTKKRATTRQSLAVALAPTQAKL